MMRHEALNSDSSRKEKTRQKQYRTIRMKVARILRKRSSLRENGFHFIRNRRKRRVAKIMREHWSRPDKKASKIMQMKK